MEGGALGGGEGGGEGDGRAPILYWEEDGKHGEGRGGRFDRREGCRAEQRGKRGRVHRENSIKSSRGVR